MVKYLDLTLLHSSMRVGGKSVEKLKEVAFFLSLNISLHTVKIVMVEYYT